MYKKYIYIYMYIKKNGRHRCIPETFGLLHAVILLEDALQCYI